MAEQAQNYQHPLHQFGFRRPPHWLWRKSQRAFVIVGAIQDIWLIVTGRCSLHRAWQKGSDDGSQREYRRIIVNGGELVPYVTALREARGAIWELGAWKSKDAFERDPSVKAIDAILNREPWCRGNRVPGVIFGAQTVQSIRTET